MVQHCSEAAGAADDPELAQLIGKRVGNFVLSSVLGQGGMGAVLLAEHPALGRRVAVKFLSRMLAAMPEMSARFLDEARSAASLQHPNIVDILDFGMLDHQPYYVMEHLQGADLSRVLATKRRLPPEEVCAYLLQVGAALELAHARGIVHRDLKPANVFVREGAPLHIKLLDFGIAKLMDGTAGAAMTRSGQVMGTPSHMAPEQALGAVRDIGPHTDIYSLGVILYEMLTGKPLFEHESPVVVMMMHIRDAFVPIRTLAPEVPERVASLVEGCLAKRPADRPASVQMLVRSFVESVRDSSAALPQAPRAPTPASAPRSPMSGTVAAPSPRLSALAVAPTVVARSPSPSPCPSTPQAAPVAVLGSALAPEAPSPPEQLAAPAAAPEPEVDKFALDALLVRMQTKGDFPAFMKNVTEISQKAHVSSPLSAGALAESILKDYALTAKLLRVVNTSFYDRLGKRVNNVSRAVVLLGFDKVRSTALAIAINRNPGKDGGAPEVSELSIQALVSGEIARSLATAAGVPDPEEAQVCAMFHNVGQQLLVHYLPDDYKKVRKVMEAEGLSMEAAAHRVLRVPLRALGVGMAQRWKLSERITSSMTPAPLKKPSSVDERIRLLSTFSNELSDAIAQAPPGGVEAALTAVLERYKPALALHPAKVPTLLASVQKSFSDRYAALLGLDPSESKFCRNASVVSGVAPDGSALPAANTTSDPAALDTPQERVRRFDRRLDEIDALLLSPHQPREIIRRILEVFGSELRFRRALVLVPAVDRVTLEVQSAWGEDAKMFEAELALPLGSVTAADVFSSAYHAGREEVVADAFDPKVMARVPRHYYEMVGSSAFVVYPCGPRGYGCRLLFADTDTPSSLPGPERASQLARLREMLGRRALAVSTPTDAKRRRT